MAELKGLLSARRPDGVALAVALRRAGAEVARARQEGRPDVELERTLAVGHARLFRPRWPGVWWFLSVGWWRRLRDQRRETAFAAGLLLSGVLVGWFAVQLDPASVADLLPQRLLDHVERQVREERWLGDARPVALASNLLVHNVTAAVGACVGGLAAGLGSVWALVRNGVVLGAVLGTARLAGESQTFLAFLLPHAALELPAIVLAGGAGLRLGEAVLRRGGLREAGRHAAEVVVGAGALLGLAALVEGFVSPRGAPTWVGVGVVVAVVGVAGVRLRTLPPEPPVPGGPGLRPF